jgi:hypothetical protein
MQHGVGGLGPERVPLTPVSAVKLLQRHGRERIVDVKRQLGCFLRNRRLERRLSDRGVAERTHRDESRADVVGESDRPPGCQEPSRGFRSRTAISLEVQSFEQMPANHHRLRIEADLVDREPRYGKRRPYGHNLPRATSATHRHQAYDQRSVPEQATFRRSSELVRREQACLRPVGRAPAKPSHPNAASNPGEHSRRRTGPADTPATPRRSLIQVAGRGRHSLRCGAVGALRIPYRVLHRDCPDDSGGPRRFVPVGPTDTRASTHLPPLPARPVALRTRRSTGLRTRNVASGQLPAGVLVGLTLPSASSPC